MKRDIDHLQAVITPHVMGLFWITEKKLIDRPRPFYALDYFFNGGLVNYYQHEGRPSTAAERQTFFISSSFGEPFFLGHLKASREGANVALENLMTLTKSLSFNNSGKSILVLDSSHKKLYPYLVKKYGTFQFETLELK